MNLKKVSKEIQEILEEKRNKLELKFIEEKHIYYMKDVDGKIKTKFPSVSQTVPKKKFKPTKPSLLRAQNQSRHRPWHMTKKG